MLVEMLECTSSDVTVGKIYAVRELIASNIITKTSCN